VPNPLVEALANMYGTDQDISPEFIKAWIEAESSGNPRVRSKKGAVGLLQLRPLAAKEVGVKNRLDPEQNVQGGVDYLYKLWDRFGDLATALAAYNVGPSNIMGGQIPKSADPYLNKILSRSHPKQTPEDVLKGKPIRSFDWLGKNF